MRINNILMNEPVETIRPVTRYTILAFYRPSRLLKAGPLPSTIIGSIYTKGMELQPASLAAGVI